MFFLQLDPNVLKGWASDDPMYENSSLIQQCGGNITDPIPCSNFHAANINPFIVT
jgi:sodium-dependent phosphate cotransporter